MEQRELELTASQLLLEMVTRSPKLAWEILVRLHAEDGENFKTIRRKGTRHEHRVGNLMTNRLLDAERELTASPDKIMNFLRDLGRAADEYSSVEPQNRLLFFDDVS